MAQMYGRPGTLADRKPYPLALTAAQTEELPCHCLLQPSFRSQPASILLLLPNPGVSLSAR